MHKYKGQDFLLYFLIFLPLTFGLGIVVTEIFVFFSILFFFFKNRNYDYFKNKKFLFLLTFSLYIAINGILKIQYNDLLIPSIFHFRYVVFSISILFILDFIKDKINLEKIGITYSLFFIIYLISFDALFQFITGENILGFKIIGYRISGIFGSELILGSFLIKILPLILWLLFYLNFNFKKNFFFLICFFSLYFICIYISGERTAFVSLFILLFFLILYITEIRTIILLSLTILILFIGLTSFFNIGKVDTFNRIFIKTFNQVTNHLYIEEKDLSKNKQAVSSQNIDKNFKIFSTDHNGHYVLAYYLFTQQPIFGVGPRGFRNYCRSVEYDSNIGICTTHPHNTLLQILSETGIVGLIFYLYGIFFIMIKVWKAQKKSLRLLEKSCFTIISIGLLINLFPFLPSGNFFNNWVSITNYYFLGLYLYSYKRVYK